MVTILSNVFSEEIVSDLNTNLMTYPRKLDEEFGRLSTPVYTPSRSLITDKIKSVLQPIIETVSTTAVPSYAMWVKYSPKYGTKTLPPHIDRNACTYTIDYQLRSSVSWPLYVNSEKVVLEDNQAAVYYGEDELHWRNEFPTRNHNDYVEMIFFHYVEPDHWSRQVDDQVAYRTSKEFNDTFQEKQNKLMSLYYWER
jgi:hypothetical protein